MGHCSVGRRVLLWVLGATVLLLLAIIVSQQLWLWTVVRPDTPADALVLYAFHLFGEAAPYLFRLAASDLLRSPRRCGLLALAAHVGEQLFHLELLRRDRLACFIDDLARHAEALCDLERVAASGEADRQVVRG